MYIPYGIFLLAVQANLFGCLPSMLIGAKGPGKHFLTDQRTLNYR